jgi:hypothetical protein
MASADPDGLLAALQRSVVTRNGEDRRIVREDWSLAPL